MKVYTEWLQEYIEEELPGPEDLSKWIGLRAFEVEGVEKVGDGAVLDVDILPNRAHDCLSHRGIAREIAAIYGFTFKDREVAEPGKTQASITVEVADLKRCPRYSALVVSGVTVGPSPDWLRKQLEAIGERSINNVVDVTNYVMFDLGQPLHAFDKDKLDGETITVRSAEAGEHMTTLDGQELEFSEGELVIADERSPLAIAGVKGGAKAEVNEGTKSIVLEAAHFDPVAVRRVSRGVNIITESSKRFENHPSPRRVEQAIRYAAELIKQVAGGESEAVVDNYPEPLNDPEPVTFPLIEIEKTLGMEIPESEVTELLERLACTVSIEGDAVTVTPPEDRFDLAIKEDIIEEVGRLHGYEHLSPVSLSTPDQEPSINKAFYYRTKVQSILQRLGYTEIYGYSIREKGQVALQNPLNSDRGALRDELASDMAQALAFNVQYAELVGTTVVKLFEVSNVFTEESEVTRLAFGVMNTQKKQKPTEEEIIHETVQVLSEELGVELDEFRVNGGEERVYEVDLSSLVEKLPEPQTWDVSIEARKDVAYRPNSMYPFMLRDVAVFTPGGTESDEVLSIIKEQAGPLLVKNRLFDVFEKTQEDGSSKVSYAFRLVFQSYERTLSDEEVNKIMEEIYTALSQKEGWEIR